MIILLKILFILISTTVTILTSLLFALSWMDLKNVRKDMVNGAILFMAQDNRRHQGALLCLSCLLLFCAIMTAMDYYFLTLPIFILMSIGGLLDALRMFHRRKKMAQLVGEYMYIKGGRRKTDPPADYDY